MNNGEYLANLRHYIIELEEEARLYWRYMEMKRRREEREWDIAGLLVDEDE